MTSDGPGDHRGRAQRRDDQGRQPARPAHAGRDHRRRAGLHRGRRHDRAQPQRRADVGARRRARRRALRRGVDADRRRPPRRPALRHPGQRRAGDRDRDALGAPRGARPAHAARAGRPRLGQPRRRRGLHQLPRRRPLRLRALRRARPRAQRLDLRPASCASRWPPKLPARGADQALLRRYACRFGLPPTEAAPGRLPGDARGQRPAVAGRGPRAATSSAAAWRGSRSSAGATCASGSRTTPASARRPTSSWSRRPPTRSPRFGRRVATPRRDGALLG